MRLRRLTVGERRLAAAAFSDGLRAERLWLAEGAPTGSWAIVVFSLMLFPSRTEDFSIETASYQAWFVHELTHAWQFQTRPLWTLLSLAKVAFSGSYLTRRAYRYGLPLTWDRLNLEQQAKAVEHGFLLRRGLRPPDMPDGARPEDYPPPAAFQRKSRR